MPKIPPHREMLKRIRAKAKRNVLAKKTLALIRLYNMLQLRFKGKLPKEYSKLERVVKALSSGDEGKVVKALEEIRKFSITRELERIEREAELGKRLKGAELFRHIWRLAKREERIEEIENIRGKIIRNLPKPKNLEEKLEFERVTTTLAEMQILLEEVRGTRRILSEILKDRIKQLKNTLTAYLNSEGEVKEKALRKLRNLERSARKFLNH